MAWHSVLSEPALALSETIYRSAVKTSQAYYKTNSAAIRKVSAKVISVGNITWGGTGKTPLIIMLARVLSARGKRVAVLTRGYGQDEVYELQNSLAGIPVLVGRDRIRTAQEAIKKYQSEIILMDDGYQHLRLHRDLDIVAINATNPFGNGRLIPRGMLREPLENLSRANVFVITKSALGRENVNLIRQKIRSVNPEALVFEADHRPIRLVDNSKGKSVSLDSIKRKRVGVISGIEDPISFERTVSRLDSDIVYAARFEDHHIYIRDEIVEVLREFKQFDAEYMITTMKDYYRLGRVLRNVDLDGMRMLILQMEIRMDEQPAFIRRCLS